MKAFITGASGFIGSRLSAELIQLGHTVVAPTSAEMDITRASSVSSAIESALPDWIFHLAAQTRGVEEDLVRVNVTGSENVVRAAEAVGVRALVIAGTNVEYGDAPNPYTESTLPHPTSAYGRTKLQATIAALAHSASVPVTVLRFSNVYGPGGRSLVDDIRSALRSGAKVRVSEAVFRDFIHVDDVTRALILAATQIESVRGRVLNICFGEARSTADIARTAATLHGMNPVQLIATETFIQQSTDQVSNSASNDLAKKLIDWSPRVPLEAGLSLD